MSTTGRMTAEKIVTAMELVSRRTLEDEQAETVKRFSTLTNCDWTVDAGPLDVDEHDMCANDSDHGRGTCYIRLMPRDRQADAPDLEGVCPDCGIEYLTREFLAGDYACVEVTR